MYNKKRHVILRHFKIEVECTFSFPLYPFFFPISSE